MKNNDNINLKLNFPVYDGEDFESSCRLFHCVQCGFHPKAYTVAMAVGDEEKLLVKLMHVLPNRIQVKHIFGEILTDTEIIEHVFCGMCGLPGDWTNVPLVLLETMNMIKPNTNKEDEMIIMSDITEKGVENEK